MKNFGFADLFLIDPRCDLYCDEARNRAKHAQDIIDNARIGGDELFKTFDLIVATSGKLGSDYNIPRIPLTPEGLNAVLKASTGRIALLFGRESHGLTNEELACADLLVTIPAASVYPVLNLSHAVAILLYEISKSVHDPGSRFPLADRRQKEELLKLVDAILARLAFATEEKRKTQRLLWHRVAGLLTRREAQAMLGFCRKVRDVL